MHPDDIFIIKNWDKLDLGMQTLCRSVGIAPGNMEDTNSIN